MVNTQELVGRRMAWFLLAVALVATISVGVRAGGVRAAEPAADQAAEQPAAAPASETQETPTMAKSWFRWLVEASGFIGLVILVLSVYFVATVSRLFWELRLPVAIPPEIVGRCQDLLGQRDFKGVFAVVKDDDSIFSRLLTTGISELPNGLAEARDAMERVGEAVRVELEKRISVLAVLGTLGPMIGLIGTLQGMIASFSVIARSDVQMKASEVAGGISMALVLTFEGVSLAVPAIWFFSVFRNRISVIMTTAGLEADQFLRHFAHAARAKTPAAGATTTTKVAPRLE